MLHRRDTLAPNFPPDAGAAPAAWVVAPGLTGYAEAVAEMEARVEAIAAGTAPERVWLVEHPPLYTAGTSARNEDLIDPSRFPVFAAGRGGQYTYHGPGQRVAYVMLDLEPARAGRTRATSPRSKPGSSRRLPPSMSAASGGRIGSASGWGGPTRRTVRRTRSPPSASAFGAG